MSNLADLVEPLKRAVAVPGQFATSFPVTQDEDLLGSLADAFAAAQLDGFFGAQSVNLNTFVVTPDLSQAGGALVLVYSAERILQAKILSMRTKVHYEAGPAKYEVENAATVLTQVLRDMRDRKNAILSQAMGLARAGTSILMQDQYTDRVTYMPGDYIGLSNPLAIPYLRGYFYQYELAGA